MLTGEVLLRFSGWGVATLFVLLSAYLAYRQLKGDSPSINLLIYLFLAMFISSGIIALAGFLGLLDAVSLTAFSLIGLSLYALIPSARRGCLDGVHDFQKFLRSLRAWWEALPPWVRWALGVFVIYSSIRFVFLVWSLPPFVWDSLTYHLTNIAHWIQSGRIELFDTPVARIYSPANYELFTTWFAVFLRHDAFVEASGIPAYVLAFVAVYAIARRIKLRSWSSLLGAMAYVSTPALILSTTGTKNDPIMAALYLTCLAIVLDISRKREKEERARFLGPFIVLVLILLYALGTKTYMLHLGPGIVVVGVLATWYEKSCGNWLRVARAFMDGLRERRIAFNALLLILIVSALFLGAFWYIRNWNLTGNPFYPYGVSFGETQVVSNDSGTGTAAISLTKLFENLVVLGEKFWDRRFPVVPDLPGTTGWGWLAYGLGLVASAWSILRLPRFRIVFAGFLVSLLTLYLSSTTSNWNMRYQIWVPALFAIALAAFIDWIPEEFRLARGTYIILFLVSISLNLSMTVTYNRVPLEKFEQMLSMPVWSREASIFRINMPEEYEHAFTIVPEGDLLGYNVTGNGFLYPLYKSDFSQRLVYVPFTAEDRCNAIADKMREAGTKWLFVAREHSEDTNIARLRACADDGTVIRERAKGLYVIQ